MESQNIEYKQIWKNDYLQHIAGFANSKGGKLVIGADDMGNVVGVPNAKKLMEDIPNMTRDSLGLIVDVNLVNNVNVDIVEIIVGPSQVPISYHGQYYYRSGCTNQLLNGVALHDFLFSKFGKRWDILPEEKTSIRDVDPEAIDYFLKVAVMSGRLDPSERHADTLSVLKNLQVITEDGELTKAGVLLFTHKPKTKIAGAHFKVGRFGRNDADLIFDDEVDCNILQMVDKVIALLRSKYLICPIHYEGMVRMEPLEIPEDGLREILYNAICHKAYMTAPIQMKVFNDYIEVWNEGELPFGTTVETFLNRHESRPRNPSIAEAFHRAGFIELWGRGFSKIKDTFEKAGYPMPKVESIDGSLCVTIKRRNPFTYGVPNDVDASTNGAKDVVNSGVKDDVKEAFELSDRQRNIINIIRKSPFITTQDLAQKIGCGFRTIQRDLSMLNKARIIYREGGRKTGHWVVTEVK